jgi:hypothetical protein
MRVAFLVVKLAILFIVVLFGFVKVRTYYQNVKSSDQLNFYFDDNLAEDSIVEIKQFFNENKNLTLESLSSKFLETFDYISKLILKNDEKLNIFIKESRPLININNKFLITQDKKLVSKDKFRARFYENIPYILVKNEIDSDVLNFINSLPISYFELFNIEIESNSKVWLKDKKNNCLLILTWVNRAHSERLINISKKILKDNLNNLKKNKNLIADIRFNEQIVLFQN